MKENILPFSLAGILLTIPENNFRPTPSSLSRLAFDRRQDFILKLPHPALAVRLIFANERCLNGTATSGIRRKVNVTLHDSHKIIASAIITVCINGDTCYRDIFACLPFDFDKIDFSRPYLVTVRDCKTGLILGERNIRFFREYQNGLYAAEILKPIFAGVQPDFSSALYKSSDAHPLTYNYAKFYLEPDHSLHNPPLLPEMEVRTYFPDGSIGSNFVIPAVDKDDDSEMYYVSAPFFIFPARKGIGYAELICFDTPIAGFVFNTDGKSAYGGWFDPNLEPIDEYSLDAATERFNDTIKYDDRDKYYFDDTEEPDDVTDKSSLTSDDDFEQALQAFISSNLDPDNDDTDEEPDSNVVSDTSDITEKSENSETLDTSINDKIDKELKTEASALPQESISPLKALDNLTGLHSVKEKLKAYEKLVIFNKKREDLQLPTLNLPLHCMFLGSPGTGKTTVAKRMGLMLRRTGVLSKGHVVVRERATLLGPNYSNEETNTLAAIEEARGGILFIDEAYQLYQPHDPRDPGKFVIETLMSALADESKRDWMLILAGYTEEMIRMFEMNPGLKSRIPESNVYLFDDFSREELMEIAERYLERNRYSLSPEAKISLFSRLGHDSHNRDRNFGNARYVINLIQTEIIPAMASRVINEGCSDEDSLSLIRPCDIPMSQKTLECRRTRIGYCA